MGYLFFQTWVWLLIAFILGLLAGGFICWLCCRKKQQENDDLRQQLAVLSSANVASEALHLSESHSQSCDLNNGMEPEVTSMVETMVETVIETDEPPSVEVEEVPAADVSVVSTFFTEVPEKVDDLKRIKGIGAVLQKVLNELGIYQFKQIAEFTDKDIEWVNESLSFPGRIEREQWVEQAKTLSKGEATEFSQRVDKGDVEY